MYIPAALAFAIFIVQPAAQAKAPCLSYGPAKVTLSGKLERRTLPGVPNYESARNGDKPETHFYLKLSSPICTTGDRNSAAAHPVTGVSRIQLIFSESDFAVFRPLTGKRLTVQGALISAHTGHHHARVLMDHVAIVRSNSR
jgi:Domain of unknown function (DUF4431)